MATLESSEEKQAAYAGEPVNIDGLSDKDGRDMARMGKKQEFERNFNWISSVGFTSCTMGT
jgi:hypothetical protein